MTADDILEEMKREVTRDSRARVFAGGLLPAFCSFFLELDHPDAGYKDIKEFYSRHPQKTDRVNTLTVLPDGQGKKYKTIRQPYEKVARYFIDEKNRITFPSAAPHATGQWHDYQHWLEALVTYTPDQLEELSERAKLFMLSWLPENKFDPSSVEIEPPIFHIILEQFPWNDRRGKEKTGAAFQAMVFAYIRADAPHLQVETRRVRTGSARVQGIGDIDAWDGRKLTISAEVKHFTFDASDVADIRKFINKVRERGALGYVVATNFADGVTETLQARGMKPLTIANISHIVSLWDPLKQKAALNALEYAIWQKELSIDLGERLDQFLVEVGYRTAMADDKTTEPTLAAEPAPEAGE